MNYDLDDKLIEYLNKKEYNIKDIYVKQDFDNYVRTIEIEFNDYDNLDIDKFKIDIKQYLENLKLWHNTIEILIKVY